MLGSLVKVWPWANVPAAAVAVIPGSTGNPVIPDQIGHLPDLGPAILWCLIGIALIVAIEFAGNRIKEK